ncbi:MAG TPA: hypothetical protein VGE55_03375 [Limnobacter sp.]|uniref:hypothetical protein n=1 Tax=Limnobacter sp. TaxID=2003368 RepID=UPI002EDBA49A
MEWIFNKFKYGWFLRFNPSISPQKCRSRFDREVCQIYSISPKAGNFNLDHPPVSAKDYGPTLAAAGFVEHQLSGDMLVGRWACKVYQPSRGDIAVIPAVPGGGPHGHIAMFDGQDWYSDFKQNDMWGGPKYRQAKPSVQLFKYAPQ